MARADIDWPLELRNHKPFQAMARLFTLRSFLANGTLYEKANLKILALIIKSTI